MSLVALIRWLRRSGVELRLRYVRGTWRLRLTYPDETSILLVAPALADHIRTLRREMARAA